MSKNVKDNSRRILTVGGKDYTYYSLQSLVDDGMSQSQKLPYSIRVLLESVLRQYDGQVIKDEHIEALANWDKGDISGKEVPFKPSRVILQDFTDRKSVV